MLAYFILYAVCYFILLGTGGPAPGSTFKSCDGTIIKRTHDGGIPDEVGQEHQKISNTPGTLSMANTGK